jgi:polysaccharide pyruvyl transferase WcaK-like protein
VTETTRTPSPARILLLGTHGQYNIGDELLLATFLHQLGVHHEFVVNTYDAADTAARLGSAYRVSFIDTARDRVALLRALRWADAVVFAGGSILKELSAATGRNRYATLLMILAVVTAARWIARVPMAMLNIGIGPIRTRRGRRLTALILRQVHLVTVRDAGSAALSERIGVRRSVITATDAVFSVEPSWLRGQAGGQPDAGAQVAGDAPTGAPQPLRIALSLNHDIDVPENWEPLMATLAGAFTELAARRPIEIHGLPMQSRGKKHDDASVLREFAARVPTVTVVDHRPDDHHDVAAIIDRCDLLVAERLHAIITSATLGVPVVPLAYDVKVRQVAVALGLDELTIDLAAPFEAEQLVDAIERVAADPDAARTRLGERTAQLSSRARSSFDDARAWLDRVTR